MYYNVRFFRTEMSYKTHDVFKFVPENTNEHRSLIILPLPYMENIFKM